MRYVTPPSHKGHLLKVKLSMDEPFTMKEAIDKVYDTSHGVISVKDVHFERRGVWYHKGDTSDSFEDDALQGRIICQGETFWQGMSTYCKIKSSELRSTRQQRINARWSSMLRGANV